MKLLRDKVLCMAKELRQSGEATEMVQCPGTGPESGEVKNLRSAYFGSFVPRCLLMREGQLDPPAPPHNSRIALLHPARWGKAAERIIRCPHEIPFAPDVA